jgi:hypothetical protein
MQRRNTHRVARVGDGEERRQSWAPASLTALRRRRRRGRTPTPTQRPCRAAREAPQPALRHRCRNKYRLSPGDNHHAQDERRYKGSGYRHKQ